MVALVDGVPRTLNLAQCVSHYVDHQVEVVTRRSEFRLDKARDRAHIVEGLLKAIDMLDAVIAAIRASEDRPAARDRAHGRAVLLQRGAGRAHPRHDARPAHPPRPDRTSRRRWPSCGETIAELEAILADPAQPAGRHRRASWARSGPSTPTTAGPQITHDPGELGVEDLIERRGARRHHDPGRLHQGRPGGVVPHPGPRRARRAGGAAQRGGPRRRRGPHHRARLPAAVLQPGPGLPAAGARGPHEGAHGAGHGRRQPAAAGARARRSRPSSPPATSTPAGS